MNDNLHIDGSTRIGTIGGTLLVTLLNIWHNDIVRTIGFAALGASVSFFVSLFWKILVRRIESQRMKRARRGSDGGDRRQ